MRSHHDVSLPLANRQLGIHALLLGILIVFALLAFKGSDTARGASSTPGIGILRYGATYDQASGYDRYSSVIVGIRDAATAGSLPTRSLVYMSAPAVQPAWLQGVSYEDALANGWLLKNSSGSYIKTPFGAYLADIGSPGYRQRWLENVIPFIARNGNEGIFVDDVVSTAAGWGEMPTKYPTHQAWEDAMVSFVAAVGGALRSQGYYVLANAASVIPGDGNSATGENFARFNERLAPHVSGIMDEYWMQAPHGSSDPLKLRSSGTSHWTQHWDTWINVLTRTQNAGADFYTVMYGSSTDVNTMRYGKATFLLEWNGSGGAYLFETSGDPWNSEWTMDIGQPTGSRYQVGVGWRRDYTGGTVILNSNPSASQTFSLGGTYTQANGTSVSSVTLGPVSALILKGQTTPSPPPPATAPTNTAPPVITGVTQQGVTLSASPGTWSNSPTAYAFHWKRCDTAGANCTSIGGFSGPQYLLVSADVGKRLLVTVTASNAAGAGSATSQATGLVAPPSQAPPLPPPPPSTTAPTNTALPMISGTPQQGSTLTASTGSWSNSPTGYAYQWKRCDSAGANCVSLAGSTGTQNTLGSAAVGKTLRVTVTASNEGGSRSATSNPTAVIGSAPAPSPPAHLPKVSVRPEISGTPQEALTLSTSTGIWENSPKLYGYQWRRCNSSGGGCDSIDGATGPQYTVRSADVGRTLRVVVAAWNDAGGTYTRTDPTALVAPKPAPTPPAQLPQVSARPQLSGTSQEGLVLSTSTGDWSNSPKLYGYQWRRCNGSGAECVSIDGATGPQYTLRSTDVGSTIRVVVAAWNDWGVTYTRTDQTALVSPRPAPPPAAQLPQVSVRPHITGTPQERLQLSTSTGIWFNSPKLYGYQWRRCDSAGAGCVSIDGATGPQYTVRAADVGRTLRVVVAAWNQAGVTYTRTDQTALVASGSA